MSQCAMSKNGFSIFQSEVDTLLLQMNQDKIVDRIRKLDHTVWQPEPNEITNRLGWLDIANRLYSEIPNINQFVQNVKADGFKQVLLLGMGGSSLAPELFAKTFGPNSDGLDVRVLDSTDPVMVLSCKEWIQKKKTLFIVSSKSGGTAETFSFFKYFYTMMKSELGDEAGNHFIVITDPGSKLEQISNELGFRKTFINDPNIGGRFSVLSYFGLIPAALTGLDIQKLVQSAIDADWSLAVEIGVFMGHLALNGIDKLTFIISPQLQSFGDWVEQLIAESTGKHNKGILPVVGESLLSADQYGEDRFFIHLKLRSDSSNDAQMAALADAGYPVLNLTLYNLYQLGEQFFIWELATAVCGHLLKINPFDQPNVESAKVAARTMINTYLENGSLPDPETATFSKDSLMRFLDLSQTGDYISIQAFIPMNTETMTTMQQIQESLQKLTRLAVTVGFGPRFLHSTGQLHKGDRGNGLFIQLTCDASKDIPIPNEPGDQQSDMSFHILKTAQAMGDYQAIKNENRPVIHFHLSKNIGQALTELLAMI
ncbi:glucose-6-phosphate isomerase [bacterium]